MGCQLPTLTGSALPLIISGTGPRSGTPQIAVLLDHVGRRSISTVAQSASSWRIQLRRAFGWRSSCRVSLRISGLGRLSIQAYRAHAAHWGTPWVQPQRLPSRSTRSNLVWYLRRTQDIPRFPGNPREASLLRLPGRPCRQGTRRRSCPARNVIAAFQDAYRYSLITPPSTRVRRSCRALRLWTGAGCSWRVAGS